MIPYSEIRVLDKNAEYFGVPPETLMENAGKHVADFVQSHYAKQQILVLCGVGNNGGDGFVAARHLAKKYPVTVFLVGHEKDIHTTTSKKKYEKLKNSSASLYNIEDLEKLPKLLENAGIILDAMLGIGVSGNLRDPYASLVKSLKNLKDKTIISVDIPTGLGADLSVHPQATVTFHDAKEGMTKETCGKILAVDIGIPPEASLYVGPGDFSVHYPKPKKTSHKGENGKVLVIGGGAYLGAPVLSGLAALRTGSDLVYIASPKETSRLIRCFSPNLIVYPLVNSEILTKDAVPDILKYAEKVDSVVIGPGLGIAYETMDAVQEVVAKLLKIKKSLVLDADGLKAIAKHRELLNHTQTVITPHQEEFAVFTGEELPDDIDTRKKIVFSWAKKLDITIFLKGPVDIISDGKTTRLNTIHNEAMTVGGTGDVLAGIIGSLLSKQIKPFHAARIGAFLNGEAGNQAFSTKSYGLLATDIIEEIPTVLAKYL